MCYESSQQDGDADMYAGDSAAAAARTAKGRIAAAAA